MMVEPHNLITHSAEQRDSGQMRMRKRIIQKERKSAELSSSLPYSISLSFTMLTKKLTPTLFCSAYLSH